MLLLGHPERGEGPLTDTIDLLGHVTARARL